MHTSNTEIPGRWAGDRIAVVGDYDDSDDFGDFYRAAGENANGWRDISADVVTALCDDSYLAQDLEKTRSRFQTLVKEAASRYLHKRAA